MEEISGRSGQVSRHAGIGELIEIWASYRAMLEEPRDLDVTEEDAQVRAGQYLESSLADITYSDVDFRMANNMVFADYPEE